MRVTVRIESTAPGIHTVEHTLPDTLSTYTVNYIFIFYAVTRYTVWALTMHYCTVYVPCSTT